MMEIDLEQIIRDRKPGLARWMPRFVMNYIKRTVHVDWINDVLRRFGHLSGAPFVEAILDDMQVTRIVEGVENVDPSRRYIFASNHPLGGLDGLAIAAEFFRIFGDTKLIVNDLLMNLGPLQPLFVPVNKYGKQPAGYARMHEELYRSDAQIVVFPAGFCSRKIHGKIQDIPWKKNFISKAIEYERDVVPVYVEARNSNFFYNLSNFRKRLGLPNIELFWLPDELYRQHGRTIRITIGQPVAYTRFKGEKSRDAWAQTLREIAYSLKKE